MNSEAPTPAPQPRRRRRAFGVVLALVGFITLSVLGINTWATWAVNGALIWTNVPAEVTQVKVNARQSQLSIVGLAWQSDREDVQLRIDTVVCAIPEWHEGRWHVASIEFHSIEVASTGGTQAESGPPFWEDLELALHIDQLQWHQVGVTLDGVHTAQIRPSRVHNFLLDANGLRWDNLNLGGGSFVSPVLPDTLRLNASQCSASWSPMGIAMESEGLHLPGLAFQGNLTWPVGKGQGHVELDWPVLRPWLDAAGGGQWVDDLGLGLAQTTISWSVLADTWEVSAEGPSWLSGRAGGNDTDWRGRLDLTNTPPVVREVWPANTCAILMEGTASGCQWTVVGDTSVSVRLDARIDRPWGEWLPNPPNWPHIDCHVGRWGTVIASDGDMLTASVHPSGDGLSWVVAQLQATPPWSLTGAWEENDIDLRAEAGPWVLEDDTLSLSSQARVEWRGQHLDWRGLNRISSSEDTLLWTGAVDWGGAMPKWETALQGTGLNLNARGEKAPWTLLEAIVNWLELRETSWPTFECTGQVASSSLLLDGALPQLGLEDTASFLFSGRGPRASLSMDVPEGHWSGTRFGPATLSVTSASGQVKGHGRIRSPRQADTPWALTLGLQGNKQWRARVNLAFPHGQSGSLALEARPPQQDSGWRWGLLETRIPTGENQLTLQNGPVYWDSNTTEKVDIAFAGGCGSVELQCQRVEPQGASMSFQGWAEPEWISSWHPSLQSHQIDVEGLVEWNPSLSSALSGMMNLQGHDVTFEAIAFPSLTSSIQFREGLLHADIAAENPSTQTQMRGVASWDVAEPEALRIDAQLTQLPLAWMQPWVDTNAAVISGQLDASLMVSGDWRHPTLSGRGSFDTLVARVPSLGTSFGGSGAFDISTDEVVLRSCVLSDQTGSTARVEGALLHDQFRDWNFDISMVDTPEDMVIMDLPPSPDLPVSGMLVGRGSVDAFFWNNRLEVRGDVSAESPTDFTISLEDGSSESWGTWVTFATEAAPDDAVQEAPEDELSVLLDLQIQAKPEAQVTILTDPENDANLVGSTEGNIHLTLEDWERMTLTGSLSVVEGRYDFALGPLLRKQFTVEPGGTLLWSGDPYQGNVDLHAKYTTRANVQPLLGSASTGIQNEDIDVILHLSGPMLQPNIGFDLNAPRAPTLVSEALATAVLDDAECTRQAIALLSLQEFLPEQINTLALGTTGLQEYSIDMVTSQLSQWLSKINEDIDVGIRYDATSALNPASVNQDALQLALKASFFQDKLEVEGAVGSRDVTQEALGEAQLQNVRILYNLNEERGLQLTGFSESQSSATQSGNTTSQGVGIRWHRSFNWTWPWNQSRGTSNPDSVAE